MYEKKLQAVLPVVFTANGGIDGKITVTSTLNFKVKQVVILKSSLIAADNYEIKRVDGPTVLYVGLVGSKITDRSDVSAYLLADNATISASEQNRPNIPEQEIERLTYEEEPTVARRAVLVDPYGNKYTESNPLPTSAKLSIDSATINVDLDAFAPVSPDSVLVAGSEDGTLTGVKHVVRVDASKDLLVGISNGANKAAVNVSGELSVTNAAANASLASIDTKLTSPLVVSGTVAVSNLPATQNVAVVSTVEVEVKNDTGNPLPVSASALPLPTGASTSTLQTAGNSSLASIDSKLTNPLPISGSISVSNFPATQAVTAVSLPLPIGAATSTLQTAANASLASIDTKLTSPLSIALADEPIKISGTENGLSGGVEFTYVNNVRLQILAGKDRVQNITYADFGTKNQRVTLIDYVSPSIGVGAGFTARKTFIYTLVGNSYRRDSINWSII